MHWNDIICLFDIFCIYNILGMNSISNSDENIFDVIDFHQETKPDSVSPP